MMRLCKDFALQFPKCLPQHRRGGTKAAAVATASFSQLFSTTLHVLEMTEEAMDFPGGKVPFTTQV